RACDQPDDQDREHRRDSDHPPDHQHSRLTRPATRCTATWLQPCGSTVRLMRTRVDVVGVISAAAAVAFVTAAIAVLKPYVPVLSLGVLYELAVLPVA